MSPTHRQRIVVIGHGMVGHRFVQAAIERGLTETHDVVVLGEEPRPAYDRVALTSYFAADSAEELSLLPGGEYDDPRVSLRLATVVSAIDPAARTVRIELQPFTLVGATIQLDDAGGATLVRHIEKLGVTVHTGVATEAITGEVSVDGLQFKDGAKVDAQVVVFSAGIRPRDALAREAGLEVAERGGVLVDEQCRTSDPRIHAIGECAAPAGRMYGLVAPGYDMAEVAVDALLDGPGTFTGADMSTKLKLLGVDVASFGDAFATTEGSLELVYSDAVAGVYKKLVVTEDGTRLLGGILVGDAAAYGILRPMVASGIPLPENPEELILPASRGGGATGVAALPDEAQVCSCNNVSKGDILDAVETHDCEDVAAVKKCTTAGTTCGSCVGTVKAIIEDHFAKSGKEISRALCEHFALSRSELFEVVAIHGYRTFDQIVEAHGTGRGCDICKRHLLRRAPHPRRRDHPGEADRHR